MIGLWRLVIYVKGNGRGLMKGTIMTYLEGLIKTTKYLSRDSLSLRKDLDQRPPEYDGGVLNTRPRSSLFLIWWYWIYNLFYYACKALDFSTSVVLTCHLWFLKLENIILCNSTTAKGTNFPFLLYMFVSPCCMTSSLI